MVLEVFLLNNIYLKYSFILNNNLMKDDLKCMKRVLRRLGFINKDDIVLTKGKVACEISACDEIIVYSNFLN